MDESEIQAKARAASALQTMALVVLLERAGGTATFNQAEYQEIVERHGGSQLLSIHHEVLATPGGSGTPDQVRFTLVRKEPGQGDLVS